MNRERHLTRRIEGARQVMDLPDDDEATAENGPLYLAWFALGNAAILAVLAFHALRHLSATEQALACGGVVGLGLLVSAVARRKLRTALAMAEIVEPAGRGGR